MWRYWPAREGGAFVSQTSPGTYVSQTLSDPQNLTTDYLSFTARATKEAAPSDGVYTDSRRTILLPAAVITTGASPKPGDQITRTRDGSTWTVLDLGYNGFESIWELHCINLSLANGLTNTGQLLRPSNTASSAGMRIPGLSAVASNIPCRIQRITGDKASEFDAPDLKVTARAYLGQQVVPLWGDVFSDGTNRYTVTGWRNLDRIDVLPELDLVDLP
jgi:hypothetical protein